MGIGTFQSWLPVEKVIPANLVGHENCARRLMECMQAEGS